VARQRGQLQAATATRAETDSARDNGGALRAVALVAAATGVLVLTAAACVLSYPSLHALAGQAGISPALARVYPVIFDALLVVAVSSVLALGDAGVLSRAYAALSLFVLLAALVAGSVVRAAGYAVPRRPAAIAAAAIPWALFLMALGLLLALLRHARTRRSGRRTADTEPAGAQGEPEALQSMPSVQPSSAFAAAPDVLDATQPGSAQPDAQSDRDGADASESVADGPVDAGTVTSEPADLIGLALAAEAARTKPFARQADLQLRGRVPASRTPVGTEMTPGGTPGEATIPAGPAGPGDTGSHAGTAPVIGTVPSTASTMPRVAVSTAPAGSPSEPSLLRGTDTSEAADDAAGDAAGDDLADRDSTDPGTARADRDSTDLGTARAHDDPQPAPAAEPPALRRPRSSPTPPED
jgi:hypothetical protein